LAESTANPSFGKSILDYSTLDFNLLAFRLGAPMEKSIHLREYRLFLEMLRHARELAGLTQEEVAARLNASQSFVSKCERGERRLDVVELRSWCVALGIPFHLFLKRFDQACER
jgi:DNA-binding XRE family transcriptional regulator